MNDDPREILRAAGVECPEAVSDFYSDDGKFVPWMADQMEIHEGFLALARLVAEQKAEIDRLHVCGHTPDWES